jgi:lipid II:glycine glycyltransferase (peptidoglycan interpeptide bridge formation enzyme)
MSDDLIEVKVDVGVLKSQIVLITNLCDKMDKVIEKLVDQHDRHISKVYVDMEEKKKQTDMDIKELHARIDTVLDKVQGSELRLMEKIDSLKSDIVKHNAKEKEALDKLFKWKWMVAGGIVVLAWLITHVTPDILASLFKN